jgi:hypothetical protein
MPLAQLVLGAMVMAILLSAATPSRAADEDGTPASPDLLTVNYPYCYENPWDRATCLKDDLPGRGPHAARDRKRVN